VAEVHAIVHPRKTRTKVCLVLLRLAAKRGRHTAALAHLAKVNGWTAADAEAYAEVVFEQWAARSRHDWTLDCTVLEAQGVHFEPTRPERGGL
jgi:hypothetical protein